MAKNAEFFRWLGHEHGSDVIVTGAMHYTKRDASGFEDVDIVSESTGQKVRQTRFVEQEEFTFELDVLYFRGAGRFAALPRPAAPPGGVPRHGERSDQRVLRARELDRRRRRSRSSPHGPRRTNDCSSRDEPGAPHDDSASEACGGGRPCARPRGIERAPGGRPSRLQLRAEQDRVRRFSLEGLQVARTSTSTSTPSRNRFSTTSSPTPRAPTSG